MHCAEEIDQWGCELPPQHIAAPLGANQHVGSFQAHAS
jgi:hypothetical protein